MLVSSDGATPSLILPRKGGGDASGRSVRKLKRSAPSERAFRVEHDEVVLPEAFEKLAARLVVHPGAAQNLANRTLAVDRLKDPLLRGVDEEREVGIDVGRIDEDGGDPARRSVLDGQRPGQAKGNEIKPGVALEGDRLGFKRAIVAIGDEAVPVHRPAQKLHRRM